MSRAYSKNSKVISELKALEKKHGVLRPVDVVLFAKNEKTALHKIFVWDDTRAAHLYRLQQARYTIRIVVEQIEGIETDRDVKIFVSMMDDRQKKGGGYRNLRGVLSDDEMRETMLAEALDELNIFRRKYAGLTKLAAVFAAIDKVLA